MSCVVGLSLYAHFTGMLEGVVQSFNLGKFTIYFNEWQQLYKK